MKKGDRVVIKDALSIYGDIIGLKAEVVAISSSGRWNMIVITSSGLHAGREIMYSQEKIETALDMSIIRTKRFR
tara:strand:- start:124 stop:345 length:222 start_codon:yes stop_codon:yes gene_type:complete